MRLLRVAASRAMDEKDFAGSEALIAEQRCLAEEVGDEIESLKGMNMAAWLAHEQGDVEAARNQWLRVRERYVEMGEPAYQAAMTVNIGLAALTSGDFRTGLEYSTEAAELFRGVDEHGTAVALQNCGWSAFGLGDTALARDSFREALVLAGRLGAPRVIASIGCGLGAVFVAEREEERGAQLLGAVSSLREELGIGFPDALEERTHEEAVADAKAALGEEAFAAAWARGQAMQPDAIVKLCDD
jgi:hypothetical protein